MKVVICCDFDGTITLKDTGKELLSNLTDKNWQYYDGLVISGEIGTRSALLKQWGMVDYTTIEEIESVVNKIEIDPTLKDFYDWVQKKDFQFVIVSDGFKSYIKKILQIHEINIPESLIKANDMELKNNKFSLNFLTEPCEHGCANCKFSHVKDLKSKDGKIIYIGDGLSDIFPARELADIIFAKEEEDLAKTLSDDSRLNTFSNFIQIKEKIERIL